MSLKKRVTRTHITLILLLLVTQVYFGSMASVAADDAEHVYVIFQDDFEEGEAGDWAISIFPDAPLGSGWAVELDDGNHVMSQRGHVWAEAGDFTWTNYTFEFKVKFKLLTSGAHINFRMSESRYFLSIYPNLLTLEKEHPVQSNLRLKETGAFSNLNEWYSIKIVCVGNRIWVYVDDELKLDYVDDENPLLSGRIGFSVTEHEIHFDDVRVSTTHRIYVAYLIKEAQDEIDEANMVDADASEAEQRLAEAQAAFAEGDLSSAEALAEEAFNMAKHAPLGPVSVNELSKYSAEYNQHSVEVSGTIRDIRYEQGIYRFAVEDSTGVVSATYNGTLGEIRSEDRVKVVGIFDASTMTVVAESLERVMPPMEGLYTFLIFKDDFEDGDFNGWQTDVDPEIEGSMWKVEKEGDNYVLSCEGGSWGWTGDSEWTDYIFELKIKVVKGGVGLGFRLTQKAEWKTYGLGLTSNDLMLTKSELYLKEYRHTELKHTSVDLDTAVWYSVKIICLKNNIKMYLNDDLKLDYRDEDDPILSGAIELGAYPSDGIEPAQILFDDVRVSRIATTSDINDLISYAQSEIDKAKEINAEVSVAELKLEQATQALTQEEYNMVQYFVDEVVWLAKRSSLGQISINELKASATMVSGHTVIVTGTVKELKARYGVGYDFVLDDGKNSIAVLYHGTLAGIEDEYEVMVTGVFDAPSQLVTASKIEKISEPTTPSPTSPTGPIAPTLPFGITWSMELVTGLLTIGAAGIGVTGWMVKMHSTRRRKKILFKNLMEEVDEVYSRFKMNAIRCEAELHRLKDDVLDEFKEGMIEEDNFNVLGRRIDDYMREVREEIKKEQT